MKKTITLKGVSTNNLQGIDVKIPQSELTVVTGRSGSGKSSLVFDTLYAESYRRYVESLSSFARQYMQNLPKPEIKSVANLPAAVAVKQHKSGATSRSSVGSLTEINDFLQMLYAHCSEVVCPTCDIPVIGMSQAAMAKHVTQQKNSKYIVVSLGELSKIFKGPELAKQLVSQGFSRVVKNAKGESKLLRLDEIIEKKRFSWQDTHVVVDKVSRGKEYSDSRNYEAVKLAVKLGRSSFVTMDESFEVVDFYSTSLKCTKCQEIFSKPTAGMFSNNHPLGACDSCQGFGFESVLDMEKVFPDPEGSISTKNVKPWNFGKQDKLYDSAIRHAKADKIDLDKPISKFSKSEMSWLMDGNSKFGGVNGFFEWLDSHKYKPHYRIHSARFKKYVICTGCAGKRLKQSSQIYKIMNTSIQDIASWSLSEFGKWVSKLSEKELMVQYGDGHGINEVFAELKQRVDYLHRVGLEYLTLQRSTRTLSGGEFQRISMARCLGSALTDTLFCLDEPTCGLHSHDTERLVEVIKEFVKTKNTVVVVEHDSKVIEVADHIIEIGPKAGTEGGQLSFTGTPKKYLQKSKQSSFEYSKESSFKNMLELSGVTTNNLKSIHVEIPIGCITSICGVSGSGKTSLVEHTLYPAFAKNLGSFDAKKSKKQVEMEFKGILPKKLDKVLDGVFLVSQGNIGRSSRSNIATYIGVYNHIRELFAKTPHAVALGMKPGAFSFNTKGGRCDGCDGLGYQIEDMSFLGEMKVICVDCKGKRFKDEVLGVEYEQKNIFEILDLTVLEAKSMFAGSAKILKILDQVIEIGLGYLKLGQSTSSFSGGEAQRLRLIDILAKHKKDQKFLFIFDEPSVGLSDYDVENLLMIFKKLSASGHTILYVEHHTGLIQASDWCIELGPKAGDQGGEVVFMGETKKIHSITNSLTKKYLRKVS